MVDLKVAFTTLDAVPDVAGALASARALADRLRIAHRPVGLPRRANRLEHGFFPAPDDFVRTLNPERIEAFGMRQVRGQWHRFDVGPIAESPCYRFRVRMLEDGVDALDGEIEGQGLRLAVNETMFTIEVQLVTMTFGKEIVGPFTAALFDMGGWWLPGSEIDERTSIAGPLAHMQLVEFLAAWRREAVPSLYIRDPSGYLEHGDVFALLEAMNLAGAQLGELMQALFPGERMPDIQDMDRALPQLSGAVGSAERVAQLEQFLFTNGVTAPDIDDMLERGR